MVAGMLAALNPLPLRIATSHSRCSSDTAGTRPALAQPARRPAWRGTPDARSWRPPGGRGAGQRGPLHRLGSPPALKPAGRAFSLLYRALLSSSSLSGRRPAASRRFDGGGTHAPPARGISVLQWVLEDGAHRTSFASPKAGTCTSMACVHYRYFSGFAVQVTRCTRRHTQGRLRQAAFRVRPRHCRGRRRRLGRSAGARHNVDEAITVTAWVASRGYIPASEARA